VNLVEAVRQCDNLSKRMWRPTRNRASHTEVRGAYGLITTYVCYRGLSPTTIEPALRMLI